MLWVKALHIIFMVTWFAGLFYLPRLFVYHAQAGDRPSIERFKVMERKLFWGIMTPGGVLTIVFGVWLWLGWPWGIAWFHLKVALVALRPATTCGAGADADAADRSHRDARLVPLVQRGADAGALRHGVWLS
jgi:uncharacterized integral membrane protein (TIGR00701 family)